MNGYYRAKLRPGNKIGPETPNNYKKNMKHRILDSPLAAVGGDIPPYSRVVLRVASDATSSPPPSKD